MTEAASLLSIVIPALDEEAAIGATIQRCLDARAHIIAAGGVSGVEILVVSDGSTDRTEAIAAGFDEVTTLVFESNRGYGAAIQCGFAHANGDLVGFLDADGTCDPRFFADLVRGLREQQADLALGARLGPDSAMPRIRALGNTLFAGLLGVLSKRSVADTASGMRVIRRSALADLYPLPDGLHFTPAMSARAMLEDKLRLIELPMSYAERVGRSKLSLLLDGLRFLTSILQAAVAFRPARLLLPVAALLALAAGVVGLYPVSYYITHRELEEWVIYRVLLASLLASIAGITLCSALVADRIASLAHGRPAVGGGLTGALNRLFSRRFRRIGVIALVGIAVLVSWPGMAQYVTTGKVDMHWSRATLSSLLLVMATMLALTTFLLHMLLLIQTQRQEGSAVAPPDRVHPARSPAAPRATLGREEEPS